MIETNTRDEAKYKLTLVIYILYAIWLVFRLAFLVGFIIALVKKNDVKYTWYETHFKYLIRTTVIGFIVGTIAFILLE